MVGFVIKKSPTFKWPVKVNVPSATHAGSIEVQQIDAEFKLVTKDEAREIEKAYQALENSDARADHEDDILRTALVGWDPKTVKNEDGEQVPFSAEALEAVLQAPYARLAFYQAYAAAISGGAAKGN